MTSAYWAQWSQAELMSMHGVEVNDYQDDDDCNQYEPDREECKECGCGYCMDCLGMSWRDFL